IGLQIALSDASRVGVAHAVDYCGVSLQRHSNAKPVDKDTGHPGPISAMTGFFLDNRRQNQCFIGTGQGQICLAVSPEFFELLHLSVIRSPQYVVIAGTRREYIGVRIEKTLGMRLFSP